MQIRNEALRMFLAVTAVIFTLLAAHPGADSIIVKKTGPVASEKKPLKHAQRKKVQSSNHMIAVASNSYMRPGQ